MDATIHILCHAYDAVYKSFCRGITCIHRKNITITLEVKGKKWPFVSVYSKISWIIDARLMLLNLPSICRKNASWETGIATRNALPIYEIGGTTCNMLSVERLYNRRNGLVLFNSITSTDIFSVKQLYSINETFLFSNESMLLFELFNVRISTSVVFSIPKTHSRSKVPETRYSVAFWRMCKVRSSSVFSITKYASAKPLLWMNKPGKK